jgi:hypothetical protein
VPSYRGQPIGKLTDEKKGASRRALLRGTPVADPELAAIIVRTSREARRSTVPFGIALAAVTSASSAYVYFHQGLTAGVFVAGMWLGFVGIVFWVVVWFLATRAIRRNTPLSLEHSRET